MPPRKPPEDAELLVLSVLQGAPLYGYAITKRIDACTDGAHPMGPGVLYPLLARLEREGHITSTWDEVKSDRGEDDAPGRRRKWYRLSPKGRKRLAQHLHARRAFLRMIEAIIGGEAHDPARGEDVS